MLLREPFQNYIYQIFLLHVNHWYGTVFHVSCVPIVGLSCASRFYLRVFRFSSLTKINISRQYGRTVYGTCSCGNSALVGKLKRVLSWKIVCLVLISVEHHIIIHRQGVFSSSITCIVLQIFTVLKYANSRCRLLTHTKYKLYFTKQGILYSN